MKVKDIAALIEGVAPREFQESYDNAGLAVGSPTMEVTGVVVCLDVSEQVVEEAISLGANMVVSHHPVIFSGLKTITGKNAVERIVLKAIQNNIALYAAHTNLDSVWGGVNDKLSRVLGLTNRKILSPLKGQLVKVATFIPISHANAVRSAMFAAGAGAIGNYDCCSFNFSGEGSFRPQEGAKPFVGELGKVHFESEVQVEVICTRLVLSGVIKALVKAHPYEEPAYDIIPLENEYAQVGLGMIGDLDFPMDEADFLAYVKRKLGAKLLRYSNPTGKQVRRVAVCGGSGASFTRLAAAQQADAYVTGDIKYHDFIDAQDKLLLVDAGHFETERFTIDIFYDLIMEKIVNFALYKTKYIDNPVNYLFH